MTVHNLPPGTPTQAGRARLFDLHRQPTAQGPDATGFEEVRILPPQLARALQKHATASLRKSRPGRKTPSLWQRFFGRQG